MTHGAKDVTASARSQEMRGSKNGYWGTEEQEQAQGEGLLFLEVLPAQSSAVAGWERWRERGKRGSREEF